jgi:hypothetical protein
VWALLMLELWFRYVVEEAPSGTKAKPPYEVTSSRGRTLT